MASLGPECYQCVHFDLDAPRPDEVGKTPPCRAFPEGIPFEIFIGVVPDDADPDLTDQEVRVLHHEPYPGDHGLQFERRPDADFIDSDLV